MDFDHESISTRENDAQRNQKNLLHTSAFSQERDGSQMSGLKLGC